MQQKLQNCIQRILGTPKEMQAVNHEICLLLLGPAKENKQNGETGSSLRFRTNGFDFSEQNPWSTISTNIILSHPESNNKAPLNQRLEGPNAGVRKNDKNWWESSLKRSTTFFWPWIVWVREVSTRQSRKRISGANVKGRVGMPCAAPRALEVPASRSGAG